MKQDMYRNFPPINTRKVLNWQKNVFKGLQFPLPTPMLAHAIVRATTDLPKIRTGENLFFLSKIKQISVKSFVLHD